MGLSLSLSRPVTLNQNNKNCIDVRILDDDSQKLWNCRSAPNTDSLCHSLLVVVILLDYCRLVAAQLRCQFNKLTLVFHASVLLLIMNFVITMSKKLWIHEAIAEWIRRLLRMKNWRPFVFYNNRRVEGTKLSQNARQ